MTRWQKFKAGVAENWKAALAGLAVLVGSILLLISRRNNIKSLEAAKEARATARTIAAKEAEARVLVTQADSRQEDIDAIKEDIAASKRRVLEINNGAPLPEEMSDDDVADLFTNSGF